MVEKRKLEVPGNAMASRALIMREMERSGISLYQIEETALSWIDHDVTIKRISFACKNGPDADWLGVITADGNDGPIVAFVSGPTFVHCLKALGASMRNGTLKWKEDNYGK